MKNNNLFYPDFIFDDRYSFAVGLVKALENKFLDEQKISKLIATKDIEDFFGELSDSYYREYLEKFKKTGDFEDLLFDIYKDLIEYLTMISPDKKIADFFNLYFDTYNIKMILKHIYFQKSYTEKLFPYGSISTDLLQMDEINIDLFPKRYQSLFKEFFENMQNKKDGELYINNLVDNFYYEELYNFINKTKSSYLLYLHKHNIELINASTLLRSKLYPFKQIQLLNHGFTPIEELKKLQDKKFEEILHYFIGQGYEKLFDIRLKEKEEILKNFIIKKNSFIKEIYKLSDYIIMGIEVLIVYFFKKREELKLLRKIYLAKLRGINTQEMTRIL